MSSHYLIFACFWLSMTREDNLSDANYIDVDDNLEPYMAFGTDLRPDEYRHVLSYLTITINSYTGDKLKIGVCSGTLINEKIIITAAHCYITYSGENTKDFYEVYIGVCCKYGYLNKKDPKMQGLYTTVNNNSVIKHNKFVNDVTLGMGNYDVMLMFLEYPFKSINTVSVLYGCPAMFVGPNKKVSLKLLCFGIGCGESERTKELLKKNKTINAAGTSYERAPRLYNNISISYGRYECMRLEQGGYGNHKSDWTYSLCSNPVSKHQICGGDSGGPLFTRINGKVKQIGISKHNMYKSKDNCITFCGCNKVVTVHLFLYMHKDWIIETAKKKLNVSIPFEDCTPKSKWKKNKKLSFINIYTPNSSQCMLQSSFPFNFFSIIIYILKTTYHYFIL